MRLVSQSKKLATVCYEIRGPVLAEAKRLEDEGHRILKLNIGNPAPFGFEAPDDILVDVIQALPTAQGYSDSKGIVSARRIRRSSASCLAADEGRAPRMKTSWRKRTGHHMSRTVSLSVLSSRPPISSRCDGVSVNC